MVGIHIGGFNKRKVAIRLKNQRTKINEWIDRVIGEMDLSKKMLNVEEKKLGNSGMEFLASPNWSQKINCLNLCK